MNSNDNLLGEFARLPDGQKVIIETVHGDGYASVRRVDGPHVGTLAVCLISKLEPVSTFGNMTEDDQTRRAV